MSVTREVCRKFTFDENLPVNHPRLTFQVFLTSFNKVNVSFRLESVQQAQAVLELIRQKEPKTNEDLNEVMETKIGNQWIQLQIDVRSCGFLKEPFPNIRCSAKKLCEIFIPVF